MAFMDHGGSVYLEGNDFGYYHDGDPIYDYFGCIWDGDGSGTYNVDHLYGQPGTLLADRHLRYMYGQEPDEWTDEIESNGGTIFLRCQSGHGRAVQWDGLEHDYRSIHSTFIFGAMIDQAPPDTKDEVMARYMDALYPDIVVTLQPDATTIPRGGTLSYDATLTNRTDAAITLYHRANVYFPSGTPYSGNPIVPLTPITIEPGGSEMVTYEHTVPDHTPLGTYTYEFQAGQPPRDLMDDDRFEFEVIVP